RGLFGVVGHRTFQLGSEGFEVRGKPGARADTTVRRRHAGRIIRKLVRTEFMREALTDAAPEPKGPVQKGTCGLRRKGWISARRCAVLVPAQQYPGTSD